MKNYRTTIVGSLLAIAVAVQPFIETGVVDLKAIVMAGFIALLGYLAKDAGVSGTEK